MGGQSKSQVVGYKYSLYAHFIFGAGVADFVSKIWFRDSQTIAWKGNQDVNGIITIDKPDLFGGQSSQGGVVGNIAFMNGAVDQMPNDYQVGFRGALTPAYRGVMSIIWQDLNIGMNPYLPTWGVEWSRIHKRISLDGVTDRSQWYDGKAAIPCTIPLIPPISIDLANEFPTLTQNVDLDYPTPVSFYPKTVTLGPYSTVAKVAAGDANGSGSASADDFFYFNGVKYGQTAAATYPAGTIFATIPIGKTLDIKIENTINPYSGASGSLTVFIESVKDINPVHWLREFKTEPWSSARIDESKLPDSVWMAAADTVYNEGLGVTFFYDGSQSIEEAMAEVCRHIGAETYQDRKTGEFKIKLIRNDYDVNTIPSFDESNIIDMSKDDTPIFGQLTTDVVVNYTDTANAFVEASITVQDIALAQQQGKRITANLDYKGFTNSDVAGRKAQQMLNMLSKPLQKRRLVVHTSAGKDLNKGDVFKFSWARENIVNMVMRVTDLNFGNGISNRIMIGAVQDEFAIPTTSFIVPPSSDWNPPFSSPTALNDRLVIEAPYLELVQLQGQSIVDLQLNDAPESAYVIAVAGTQSNATKAMLYDGISSYSQVGVLDFCATATLGEDLNTYLEETFSITGGKLLDQVTLGTWCQIDNELMRVDAISSTSITVGRGVLDTIPAKHTAGAKIWFWDNASLTDSTEFVSGNTVNVKLLTINPRGQLALSDAPVDSIKMVGRAARPYNMANVKLNGTYYASSVTGDLVLTWDNRNRLQQTSGTIYDFNDGNITPESGVTYTINVLDRDGTVGYSATGVTGTTATILTADLVACDDQATLEIYAVRSGVNSYQAYEIPFTNTNSKLRITTLSHPRITTDGITRVTT